MQTAQNWGPCAKNSSNARELFFGRIPENHANKFSGHNRLETKCGHAQELEKPVKGLNALLSAAFCSRVDLAVQAGTKQNTKARRSFATSDLGGCMVSQGP